MRQQVQGGAGMTAVLYGLFALTGVALVLPGTLLPMLAGQWHMGDTRSGLLFLLYSVGSSAGAVLARGRLHWTLAAGCVAAAGGAAGMSVGWGRAPLAWVTLYGLGLGLMMTAISLVQSRRSAGRRAAEMARLNLVWALGAAMGPSLLLRGAAAGGAGAVLRGLAVALAAGAIVAAGVVREPATRVDG